MIASYWQNLDVRYLESILSHLETTESSVLDQARQDVESLDTVSSFTPTLAVIFTWSGISFYNGFYYGYPVSILGLLFGLSVLKHLLGVVNIEFCLILCQLNSILIIKLFII